MTLAEFIRDNPNRRLILLWFDADGKLMTNYCYSNKLSSQEKRMLAMEVMDYETSDDEDWIEVWIR